VADERRAACEEVVIQGTEAVDIAAGVHVRLAAGLLGRHVGRRALERPLLGQPLALVPTSDRVHDAEVQQFGHVVHAAALADHDFARLDVVMD
jgi:hypothetical protein